MNRLLLLRHGETAWNAEHRFTTRSDVELSTEGVAQAHAVAEALAGVPLDRIMSSPMRRAAETARIVAEAQPASPPVRTDPRLVEIDAGPFEGMTEDELASGPLAAAFAAWHTLEAEPEFPDGCETFDAALGRAASFLNEHGGEPGTTLVVTHGSLARLMISSYYLGGPPPLHRRLWLDNCRLAVLEQHEDATRMVAFNVTSVD